MISEERIKELAEELWRHPKVLFQTDDYEIVLETLAQYFRTVAAEARKEGIEELLNAAEQVVIWFRVEGHGDLRSVIACIRDRAKQLKEKP